MASGRHRRLGGRPTQWPPDQPGRRRKKKAGDWLGGATQHLRDFVPRLAAEVGVSVSVRTLRRVARALGSTWKRCRRSLQGKRDAPAVAAMQQQLAAWHAAEARGEVAVVYVDECRFSRLAPVPCAWQVRGAPAGPLPAERAAGGQSVPGFWQPGVAGQPVAAYALPGAWNAEGFAAAVEAFLAEEVRGPTVLVLDNASIHRAACVRERQAAWAERGLRLCFLPAYSPELNRIEILWRFCKPYWLTPADYASDRTLQERVAYVLANVGTSYTITFG